MHGEPDRFWIGLLNSMFHIARNRYIVALLHAHQLSSFEFQGRFSTHHDDSFVLILIVPKTRRAAIRLRNDALDLAEGVFKQAQELLRAGKLWQIRK